MNFNEIFEEYYTIFRGQNSNVPAAGEREFETAVQLANNAIRKWDRADGVEWNELWTTAQLDGSGDLLTVADTTEYIAPSNMRKPPAFITIGTRSRVPVISAEKAQLYGNVSSAYAYFTGSANTGYFLNFENGTTFGDAIDYTYLKKPTLMTSPTSKPDMSDPNFMIQDMLATRFMENRNSFAYKIAKQEATVALQNMKIESISGTEGNSANLGGGGGWGVQRHVSII
jgi:hypothetical protein